MIFDGDVEKAIDIYMNSHSSDLKTEYDLNAFKRVSLDLGRKARFKSISIIVCKEQ